MELFGITFSLPVIFVTSALYSLVPKRIISRWLRTSRVFLVVSLVILGLLLADFICVVSIGTLTLRAFIGPAFYPIHFTLFFLAVPSLANVLQLQRGVPFFSKWYITALACTIFGLCVVLLQYGVSEALYGINGTQGPYS